MGFSLYIERDPSISVEEWRNAVEATEELKFDESDFVATNPLSGEEIRIPGSPENAALWFAEFGEWIKIFFFRRGRIVINLTDWDDPKSPVRDKSFELARKLNAGIVGDGGEIYTESK